MAMADVALKIYDFLRTHTVIKWSSLTFITVALIILLTKLTYKEDISDFLPVDSEEREALDIYQDISGADKVVITFSNVHVIDDFAENVKQLDATIAQRMTAQVDANSISKVQAFVYSNIPYFLTEGDYAVMDSLLNIPGYIDGQMDLNKQMLMFPSGGMMASNISRDPLNLFTPVVAKLADMHSQRGFEISDGYLFTPDMQKALVVIDSPYGNAETEQNTKLIETLEKALTRVQSKHPDVEAHITGGPAIAVGNARQIKTDATIAITLASIMILGLLWYYFRSAKSIILIAVTIVWGWLFAMGGIALISNSSVSIIVIGIASVIIGIAVNYPLHLVAHTRKGMDMREALKDISRPLIIGNITTVGAFLALVPLQSAALRDLGLFASLLLIGTILFVLIWLPQFAVHNSQFTVHSL
jgi:predicted exporter